MGLRAWLWSKLGMPAYQAEQARRYRAWDYAQANDSAIREADPASEQVTEAAALLDRNPDRAFFLLLGLAQQGSVWSMLNVGWCCEVGRGTPVSLADAEYWYRRAHNAGSDRALIEYGRILGRRGAMDLQQEVYAAGVARNWAPAIYRSAQLGLQQAQTLEARLKLKPVLERAAKLGSPMAQLLLGRYLVRGLFGIRNVPAGLRLGYVFVKGRLTELDGEHERGKEEPESVPPGATLQ